MNCVTHNYKAFLYILNCDNELVKILSYQLTGMFRIKRENPYKSMAWEKHQFNLQVKDRIGWMLLKRLSESLPVSVTYGSRLGGGSGMKRNSLLFPCDCLVCIIGVQFEGSKMLGKLRWFIRCFHSENTEEDT